MLRRLCVSIVFCVGVVASVATTGPSGPQALLDNEPVQVGAGNVVVIEFSLPGLSTIDLVVTNRSTTTPDRADVVVVPADEVDFLTNGQPFRAFVNHESVSDLNDSFVLDPGDYALGIICRNVVETCQFSVDLIATE